MSSSSGTALRNGCVHMSETLETLVFVLKLSLEVLIVTDRFTDVNTARYNFICSMISV